MAQLTRFIVTRYLNPWKERNYIFLIKLRDWLNFWLIKLVSAKVHDWFNCLYPCKFFLVLHSLANKRTHFSNNLFYVGCEAINEFKQNNYRHFVNLNWQEIFQALLIALIARNIAPKLAFYYLVHLIFVYKIILWLVK